MKEKIKKLKILQENEGDHNMVKILQENEGGHNMVKIRRLQEEIEVCLEMEDMRWYKLGDRNTNFILQLC